MSEQEKRETVHKALEETRKDTDVTDHDNGGLRCVAAQTPKEHQEMVKHCGQDSEKRKRWFRDHPEQLTASAKKHNLPKKTKTFVVPEMPYDSPN